ncbi:MAG: helix-turn-helix domain-containing protein, partial [Flavobacteriaceae bacterium]
ANNVLAILIALLSAFLFEQVMFLNGGIKDYPHVLYSTLPITFLIGPVLYLFIRLNTKMDQGWKWIYLSYFIPFAYEVAILIPFYRLPPETKISIYEYAIRYQGPIIFDQFSFGYFLYLSSTIIFLIWSFRLLKNSKWAEKKGEKKRKVLMGILIAITVFLTLNFILFLTSFFHSYAIKEVQQLSPFLLSVLIHIIGFICYLNPEIIVNGNNAKKYSSSGLSKHQVKELSESLKFLLEEKNLYLKDDLKPQVLASELGISATNLSRVISEGLNTNFYNLINEYRINEAKKLCLSKEYLDAKLIHIALDSGFSNKSSFIRNFKKFTGMSPSDFKKNSIHSSEWNPKS